MSGSQNEYIGRQDGSGNTSWYMTDRQGSVIGLTNASGTATDTIVYDGFGNITYNSASTVTGNIQFQGMYFDILVGQGFTNGRQDYNPADGRWMSEDPTGFGGGLTNWYDFTGNNPTNATDPSGLRTDSLDAANYTAILSDAKIALTKATPNISIRQALQNSGGRVGAFPRNALPDPVALVRVTTVLRGAQRVGDPLDVSCYELARAGNAADIARAEQFIDAQVAAVQAANNPQQVLNVNPGNSLTILAALNFAFAKKFTFQFDPRNSRVILYTPIPPQQDPPLIPAIPQQRRLPMGEEKKWKQEEIDWGQVAAAAGIIIIIAGSIIPNPGQPAFAAAAIGGVIWVSSQPSNAMAAQVGPGGNGMGQGAVLKVFIEVDGNGQRWMVLPDGTRRPWPPR